MANENSNDPKTLAQPQTIPLSKIHDLPGVFITNQPDKSYGGLVSTILMGGVKEPVILRQREDGEYQLLSGYRRRKASELAKKQDIPAFVYEMSIEEARAYFNAVKEKPDAPIPGKLIVPDAKKAEGKDEKKPGEEVKPNISEDKTSGQMKIGATDKPAGPGDKDKTQTAPATEKKDAPAAGKDGKAKEGDKPAGPGDKGKVQTAPATEKKDAPAAGKDGKAKEGDKPAGPGDKGKVQTVHATENKDAPTVDKDGKAKEGNKPAGPDDKDKAQTTPAAEKKDAPTAGKDEKAKGGNKPAAPGDKDKAQTAPAAEKKDAPTAGKDEKAKEGDKPAAPGDKDKAQTAPTAEKKDAPTAGKDEKAKESDKPAGPGDKDKAQTAPATEMKDAPADDKDEKAKDESNTDTPEKAEDAAKPTVAEIEKKAESGEPINLSDLIDAQKREREAKENAGPVAPGSKSKEQTAPEKSKPDNVINFPSKETTKTTAPAAAPAVAASGPTGTTITQTLEDRLTPPDEAALKSIPVPQEGESIFVRLHPAYLEKSQYNTFSVDTKSENFNELLTSIRNVGVKDPVLARFNADGKLEVLSGQRRHLAATQLNYAVPTIIQKIDDADAKILVADGNLHRDKITTYDLARALRMKMEGMKQKAGRRKKGFTADELNSDQKLAKEMGMSPQKINRIIRLSEAIKDVCDRVDDNTLTVSVASNISFLKPKSQETLMYLMDLGFKVKSEQVDRMKKVQAGGKLDEAMMRDILEDKDIAPKVQPAPTPAPTTQPTTQPTETTPAQTAQGTPTAPPPTETAPEQQTNAPTVIPSSPDVAPAQVQGGETPAAPSAAVPAADAATAEKEDSPFKGEQERPESTKIILTGDRLRKYFPDVTMTPREIEESVYEALEERRQRQIKQQEKAAIFKRGNQPKR